jgi:hypothetical protein
MERDELNVGNFAVGKFTVRRPIDGAERIGRNIAGLLEAFDTSQINKPLMNKPMVKNLGLTHLASPPHCGR